MTAFIEEHCGTYGVEPIFNILQIAPSTYYDRRAMRGPDRASARAKSDPALSVRIDAAWDSNRKLYGARKIVMSCDATASMSHPRRSDRVLTDLVAQGGIIQTARRASRLVVPRDGWINAAASDERRAALT